MVGVFEAEMAVSFRSSGVGLKAAIFGQFWTAQVGLETTFGWSYLCVVMLWTVPMNCRIFLLAHVSRFCVISYELIACCCVLIFVNICILDILTCVVWKWHNTFHMHRGTLEQ